MLNSLEAVENAVERFKALVAPEHRDRIQLTKSYVMRDCPNRTADWPKGYLEVWQQEPLNGVYLICDEIDRLLYVGKAVSIGNRLNAYFQYGVDKGCEVIDRWLADNGAAIVRAVIIPKDEQSGVHHLSPALEWSLICRLDPPGNTQLRSGDRSQAGACYT